MSVGAITAPRAAPTPAPSLPGGGQPAASLLPALPPPRPVADGVLAGALHKLSLASPELTLLALEKESNRLGVTASESMLHSFGTYVAAEHVANQEQLRKAIAAASSKSWWQKLLTVFKVIAIAASLATGGTVGAVAAGLMVAAWALEKSHPKVALGLQLAAVGLLVSNAATNVVASGVNATTAACAGWQAGTKYVGGAAMVGCAVGTAMVGHYQAAELRAQSARLLAKELLEQAQQGQRDEIAFIKALLERDARVTRDCVRVGESRHAAAVAAIRV
jgi:hypothetical protein